MQTRNIFKKKRRRPWVYVLLVALVIVWLACILDVIYYINHVFI